MALRIEERFHVDAPPGPVWDFLVDPRRVVGCVPGGELDAVVDVRTFDGKVRVKVGPITFAYRGRIWLSEVDEAARHVEIVGDAREAAGEGSARLALESWFVPAVHGTEVVAVARVDVEGRIVELGRPMLERLGHVVFQDFAACVAATIEAEEAARLAGTPLLRTAPSRRPPLRVVPVVLRALRAWVGDWLRPRRGASRGTGAPPAPRASRPARRRDVR